MLVTLLVLTVITAALHFGAPELGLHPTSRLGLRRLNDEAVALSEAGEHAEAERRLRTALQHSPGEDVLRQNLQVVLANWAIAELNAGQTAEAVRLAEAALELGEGAHVMSILGMAYVEDGDWANAKWALERAVELGESRPDTLTALGKVYRRQGDREGAVAMFQTARERGATGKNFDKMLERLERELDSEWGFAERVSPHFSIAFEEGENFRAARFVLESLEEAYEAVGHRLGHYPAERIPVVLYAKGRISRRYENSGLGWWDIRRSNQVARARARRSHTTAGSYPASRIRTCCRRRANPRSLPGLAERRPCHVGGRSPRGRGAVLGA